MANHFLPSKTRCYRTFLLHIFYLSCWSLLSFGVAQANPVVINEIHYHPASEDVREEFIELLNTGTNAVDLTGWQFTKGIHFVFPSATLAPGNFLVVAADRTVFTNFHPSVTNVMGNWTGKLSNSDETVELRDAAGKRVDRVQYADQGDWANRQMGELDEGHRGWDWVSAADGGGYSLELINPQLSNNKGQNWRSSQTTNGTPGMVNSVAQTNLPPMILEVQHLPAIPRSTDTVLVTATLLDEQTTGLSAAVFWRVDGQPTFMQTPMFDDGLHDDGSSNDGIFAALLPAQSADTVVEFYISATDAAQYSRTWPAAAFNTNGTILGQTANALYQVDDSSYTGAAPLYKLIMTEAERSELYDIGHGDRHGNTGESQSNAEMNGTFISVDGAGTTVRYALGIRNRGNGSRNQHPNSYRVNFRTDRRWKGVKGLNINGQYTFAQIIGSVLSLQSGIPSEASRPVQLRVNNANLGDNGPKTYGGMYAANEVVGDDWADHWLPENAAGNTYRVTHYIRPIGLNYRGEDPTAYTNTYAKTTNQSEDDWTDLIEMLRIIGTNDLFTAEAIEQVADMQEWMRYLAMNALVNNRETSPNTGANDDYYLYAGTSDSRFLLIPHDFDTILGGNPSTSSLFNAFGGGSFDLGEMLQIPQFKQLYYQTLEHLLNTTFSKNAFDATLDQTLETFVPASKLSSIKSWMDQRRAYTWGKISPYLNTLTNAPIATLGVEPRSPTPLNHATLLVDGVSQYRFALNDGEFGLAMPASTPISLTGLADGTNFVRVIGADTNGIWQAEDAATTSKTWIVNSALPAVRINEVLVENVTTFNHAGTFPDAIELYNEGTTTIDLSDMRLSDKASVTNKFIFPAGTLLAAGDYLVVFANNPDGTPGLHTGFSLKQSGEGIYLFGADGTLLDQVEFGQQLPDFSIGRVNGGAFVLTQPTLGAANVMQPLADQKNVRINEWLTHGFSLVPDDFVELYNPGTLPATVGGCYLTDNPIGEKIQYSIPPLSFLAPAGFQTYPLKLASEQGLIALLSPTFKTIDSVAYGPQRTDISQGRTPDGQAAFSFFALPTPGATNPTTTTDLQTENLMPMTQLWRYNQTENLDGLNWMAEGYDDDLWPQGAALLYHENGSLPAPKNTPLTLGRTTYYFRTHFSFSGNPTNAILQLSTIVDDGCVVYLNGQPVLGLGFAQGATPAYADFAERSIHDAIVEGPASIPATALIQGDNVLAVEVHQSSSRSRDIVFGAQLDIIYRTAGSTLRLNEIMAKGDPADWIELINTGTTTTDLGGMSLSDDPAIPQKWIFPAGTLLDGGERLAIDCNNTLPTSPTNTGFSLSASGDSVQLYAGSNALDSITFGLQINGFSLSRIPDGNGTWQLGLPTRTNANIAASMGNESQLRINEWMANPASGDDWLELYNPNPQPVALDALSLTDDPNNRDKSPFLPRSFMAPNGFVRLIADNDTAAGGDHVAFKLGAKGDTISLYRTAGIQIDHIAFGLQTKDVSEGRFLDGAAQIIPFPQTASPGTANYLLLENLVVNELLTHTDPPLEDAVEFLNLGNTTLNLNGWYLSDSAQTLRKFQVPSGTTIAPGGFAVLYEHQFNTGTQPFTFNSAHGGEVYLSQTDASGNLTGYRVALPFGAAANGVAFGRFSTSIGTEFVPLSARTFGFTNAPPLIGSVGINEIYFQSTNGLAGDFIELYNSSTDPVPLFDPAAPTNTWRIAGDISYTFPTNQFIPPHGTLVIAGTLPKEGGTLRLYRPDPPQRPPHPDAGFVPQILVEQINYLPVAPWPEVTPTASLQRRDPAEFGNEPLNWFTAQPSGGIDNLADTDGDGLPDYWERENGLDPLDPTSSQGAAGNPDGDAFSNLQEWQAGTRPNDPTDYLHIDSIQTDPAAVTLRFQVPAARHYQLESTDTLSPAHWTLQNNAPRSANATNVEITDSLSPTNTTRYYRLHLPAQ